MERAVFKAVIVGAGPAGLTAAYELSKRHAPAVVLESDPEYVGGTTSPAAAARRGAVRSGSQGRFREPPGKPFLAGSRVSASASCAPTAPASWYSAS
jgi:cation diffusion facilitator CzcD-associated flavoprotein CzcO